MKLFFLFAVAVIILLIANPVDKSTGTVKKESEPACCTQGKCINKESSEVPEDFLPLQFNPIHI